MKREGHVGLRVTLTPKRKTNKYHYHRILLSFSLPGVHINVYVSDCITLHLMDAKHLLSQEFTMSCSWQHTVLSHPVLPALDRPGHASLFADSGQRL